MIRTEAAAAAATGCKCVCYIRVCRVRHGSCHLFWHWRGMKLTQSLL